MALQENGMVHIRNNQHNGNTAQPNRNPKSPDGYGADSDSGAAADAARTALWNLAYVAGAGHVSPGPVQRVLTLDRRKRFLAAFRQGHRAHPLQRNLHR